MKLTSHPLVRFETLPARGRHGMAVIVVLILLSIVFLYLSAVSRTLYLLSRDLNRIEKQQVRRLVSSRAGPNALVVTNPWTASLPSRNP